jgi:small subunit ribosomal protein S16
MLVIRLARTGRTKYPTYRIVAAEKARAVTSKFVEILGHYNPHTKELVLKTEEIQKHLKNGAQPSNSVIKLLQREKVELPQWAKLATKNKAPKKEVEVKEPKAPAAEVAEAAADSAEEAVETPVESAEETVATTAEAHAEEVEANVTESAPEDTAAGEEKQAEVAQETEAAAAEVATEDTPEA